jgi:hypothetical protein
VVEIEIDPIALERSSLGTTVDQVLGTTVDQVLGTTVDQ